MLRDKGGSGNGYPNALPTDCRKSYAAVCPEAIACEIEPEIVIDPERNHYELMHIGWDGSRRVHGSVIHIDLIDGKIWIQHDGTARGVALDLIEAGVPHEDIVLGFRPPHVRQYTGYSPA